MQIRIYSAYFIKPRLYFFLSIYSYFSTMNYESIMAWSLGNDYIAVITLCVV